MGEGAAGIRAAIAARRHSKVIIVSGRKSGLEVDQAKRLKYLEREIVRLKRWSSIYLSRSRSGRMSLAKGSSRGERYVLVASEKHILCRDSKEYHRDGWWFSMRNGLA